MVIGQGQWPKSNLLLILNTEKRKVKRSDFGFSQFDTVLFSEVVEEMNDIVDNGSAIRSSTGPLKIFIFY